MRLMRCRRLAEWVLTSPCRTASRDRHLLGLALLRGTLTTADLRNVQLRRRFPTRATQKLQVFMQDNFVDAILRANQPITVPLPVRLLQRFPFLRRIPARFVGMGFRPEHVRTPDSV